ncbi:hypothetical protein CCZ01_09205 [Helicobacter monodelphidis]|uniref:hypothetical protein n=1 Tax=Helicobacter sp. 15-1451 TaxID=2004995 RepID=UPI000DCF4772|nr:hypothetical protein [Helicobacter sp. 15-1451]RAX56541.1 hypothetical protein CCZ01_09205 [Helicobacter sp. 15-1451]
MIELTNRLKNIEGDINILAHILKEELIKIRSILNEMDLEQSNINKVSSEIIEEVGEYMENSQNGEYQNAISMLLGEDLKEREHQQIESIKQVVIELLEQEKKAKTKNQMLLNIGFGITLFIMFLIIILGG